MLTHSKLGADAFAHSLVQPASDVGNIQRKAPHPVAALPQKVVCLDVPDVNAPMPKIDPKSGTPGATEAARAEEIGGQAQQTGSQPGRPSVSRLSEFWTNMPHATRTGAPQRWHAQNKWSERRPDQQPAGPCSVSGTSAGHMNLVGCTVAAASCLRSKPAFRAVGHGACTTKPTCGS